MFNENIEILQSPTKLALRIYMRLISVLLIGRGLYMWMILIGATTWHGTFFSKLPIEVQIAIIIIGILALVGAVGLWLEATWGMLIWSFIAIAEIIMHGFFQEIFAPAPFLVGLHAVMLTAFVIIYGLAQRVVMLQKTST